MSGKLSKKYKKMLQDLDDHYDEYRKAIKLSGDSEKLKKFDESFRRRRDLFLEHLKSATELDMCFKRIEIVSIAIITICFVISIILIVV